MTKTVYTCRPKQSHGGGAAATLDDDLLEVSRQSLRELELGLARVSEAPEVRAIRMDEAGQRQAEFGVVSLSGHRCSSHGHAVIGVNSSDDLAALRLAIAAMEHPEHLDDGVVGFRA